MFIETKRFILRNYRLSDFEDYFEFASQPNVGPRCGWPAYPNTEEGRKKAYAWLENKIKTNPLQFCIVEKETEKVIGAIEIMDVKRPDENTDNNKEKELGLLLNENYWNGGRMTEVIRAVIKYCFEKMNLEKVHAGYFAPNIGSGIIQAKAGMKVVDIKRNHIVWYLTGELCDLILTCITKEEFKNEENTKIYKNVYYTVNEDEKI